MEKEPLTEFTSVRLSEEQRNILYAKAKELGTDSVSVALRAIIAEWAREHQYNSQPSQPQEEPA